ncbi:MAG TPA: hypothetical protein VG501_00975 [Rhizomicrobium sp.]|nr:hypothetical protein [Rhizomicrobium sp.]
MSDPGKLAALGPRDSVQRLKAELEQFFHAAVFGTGKKLSFTGWRGAEAALKAIRKASREE